MKYEIPNAEPMLIITPKKPTGALPASLLPNLDWRSVLGRSVKPALSPPAAMRTGKCMYQIGDLSLTVTDATDCVLKAMIAAGRGLSASELAEQSGYPDARRVLERHVKRHPEFKPYLFFPGRRDRGGYRTTIKDA